MARKKQDTSQAKLPAGFKQVDVGGAFGVAQDWEKHPVLVGKCIDIRTVAIGEGKRKKDTQVMTVQDNETGVLKSVWHAYQLDGLFKEKKIKGRQVYIQYLGSKKLKGARNPMKLFSCGVK